MIRQLRESGIPPEAVGEWLVNTREWQRFAILAESELEGLASEAARAMQWRIAEAAQIGVDVGAKLGPIQGAFGLVPSTAVAELVAAFSEGSPVASLTGLNRETTREMSRILTRSLVNGTHSSVAARQVAQATSIPAARAATIARTEMFRAYREGNRVAWNSNQLIKSYRWVASLDDRTCSACWAMHGSEFDKEVPMGTHPNCRCVQIPMVPGSAVGPSGSELFDELGADSQRRILGPGKYDAFQRGEIRLKDTVRVRESKQWGTTRSVASLKEAKRKSPSTASSSYQQRQQKLRASRQATPSTIAQGIKSEVLRGAKSPAKKHFDEAIKTIQKVHNPNVVLRWDGADRASKRYGSFHFSSVDGIGKIRVRDYSGGVSTSVHEIGHAIDYQTFAVNGPAGGASKFGTRQVRDPQSPLHEWFQAVEQTSRGMSSRVYDAYKFDMKHVNYLGRIDEKWARSYEQYIGTKTGDQRILDKISGLPQYWTNEEFKPILSAMDRLFGVK